MPPPSPPSSTKSSIDLMSLTAVVGLIALTIFLMVVGESIIMPLVLSIFISYLLLALGHAFQRIRIGTWRPGPGLGLTLAILAFLLFVGGLVQIIAGNIADVIAAAPEYQAKLKTVMSQVSGLVNKIAGTRKPLTMAMLLDQVDMGMVMTRFGRAFQSIAGNAFQIVAYTAFLLLESRYFDRKMRLAIHDKAREEALRETMATIGSKIETYVLVKTAISFLVGIASFAVLTIAGVDFAPFWAMLIFVLNFIPYIGSPLGMLFPTVLALLQFGSFATALIILGFLWGAQSLIENLLEPKLMGKSLNLSPVFMILSLSVWGAIWGLTGMILAVPIMVMLMIVLSQFPTTRPLAVVMSETGDVK